MSHPRVLAVHPFHAVEGARIDVLGEGFPIDPSGLPEVRVGNVVARVVFASPTCIGVLVPSGLAEGGRVPVRVAGISGETAFVAVGTTFATGLHQVDSPAFDADGNLYVTYSGTRGQQVPVSIFRVLANGTRETFSSGIVNPTSMTVGPDGALYVSSRFEGTVYRLDAEGTAHPFAKDLGVSCGLAFASDGTLFVGDRSGTIFKVDPSGEAAAFVSLPASVAAFHLAVAPDGVLVVTGPTLSPHDGIYQIDPAGNVTMHHVHFGRPQGVAFDASGALYVVEALAGLSGLYRLRPGEPSELVLAGPGLLGVAFNPGGGLVVCSSETAYRFARYDWNR